MKSALTTKESKSVSKLNFENIVYKSLVCLLCVVIIYVITSSYTANIELIKQLNMLWLISGIILVSLAIYLSYKVVKKLFRAIPALFSEKFILIFFCVIFFIIRLAWVLSTDIRPISDFNLYHTTAIEFLTGNISQKTYISIFPHTIGYPFVLSIVYKIFGPQIISAQIFNIFCSIGTSILVYFISKRFFNKSVALYAFLFSGFFISQIFFTTLVSTESLFTLLMFLVIFIFSLTFDELKPQTAIALYSLTGLFISFANAIRPLAIILLLSIALYSLFVKFKAQKSLTILSLIAMLLVYYVCNIFIKISIEKTLGQTIASSSFGYTFLVGSNIEAGATWNAEDAKSLSDLTEDKTKSFDAVNRILMEKAKTRINANYPQILSHYLHKNSNIWGSDNYGMYWNKISTEVTKTGMEYLNRVYLRFTIISEIYYFIMLLMVTFGLLLSLPNYHGNRILFFVIILLGFVFGFIVTEVQGRYHYPALPLFAICSAYSIYQFKMTFIKDVGTK